jgi:Uma2 family endonuclease
MAALTKRKQKRFSEEEYLALEEKAEFRSEFDEGQILAMAGGSLNHARIIVNIDRKLGSKVKKSC